MGLYFSTLYKARSLRPVLRFRGLKVPVSGPHISRSVWKHLWKGDYEAPEIFALQNLLKSGDSVLELGTGMGVVSSIAAKLHPDIKIEAYEANPALIEPIRSLHKMNRITNINIHNAILLPTENQTFRKFNLHEKFTESSIKEEISSIRSIDVPVQDFRTVLNKIRPDVLVCDIEGGEEELFVGVDLRGIRAVVLELHPEVVSRPAIKVIFDVCARAGLYPRIEYSSERVVAFEKVGAASTTAKHTK